MPLLKKLCENITNVIKERVKDIDDEKAEIINYGLYLWIADIIKLAIIFTAACLLRVFKLAVVFVVCFGLLRIFAGGSHAKTFWGCLLTNSAITFGSVYLSLLLSSIKPIFLSCLLCRFAL